MGDELQTLPVTQCSCDYSDYHVCRILLKEESFDVLKTVACHGVQYLKAYLLRQTNCQQSKGNDEELGTVVFFACILATSKNPYSLTIKNKKKFQAKITT